VLEQPKCEVAMPKRTSRLLRSAGRTAGRTAVIAGTATAVSGRVARRQQGRAEQAQAAPSERGQPARANDDWVEDLQRLAQLHGAGELSDREFKAAKERLLAL
jgi:hypothetical protein